MRKRFNSRRVRLYVSALLGLVLSLGCFAEGVREPDLSTDQPVTLQVARKTLTVGAVTREYYVYTPSNLVALRESDARQIPIVFSFHDDGENGEINANATRWHELAEQYGFVVAFPSALNGGWNTAVTEAKNATIADELAFVKAIWTDFQQASSLNLSSGNPVYLTGIGTGGSVAQRLAMTGANLSSIQVISAVASIRGTADASIFSLPAGPVPAGASLPKTTMSVWLFGNADDPALKEQAEYWKNQNAVTAEAGTTSDRFFVTRSYKNPVNGFQEVRISTSMDTLSGKRLSEKIWKDMFSKVLRFLDDTRINGSLHPWETIGEMGLREESKDFGPQAGGIQRWLIYLPSNYAALTNGGKKLPLVLSLHGRKGSARFQAMMTQWHKTAEKRGFIMVYPQGPGATWNAAISKTAGTPNTNVEYMRALIDELTKKYAVDTGRIYMNGTSMGALFTNRMAVQYPQMFAAVAPAYSGHLPAEVYAGYRDYPDIRVDVPLPVWQARGGDEPDTAYPGGLAGQEAARRFWRQVVNGGSTVPSGVENDAVPTRVENTGAENRKHIRIFDETSGLKAEYRWQVTDFVPHFWPLSDQADLMWDEFFSKYRRDSATFALMKNP